MKQNLVKNIALYGCVITIICSITIYCLDFFGIIEFKATSSNPTDELYVNRISTIDKATLKGVNKQDYPFTLLARTIEMHNNHYLIDKIEGDIQLDQEFSIHLEADKAKYNKESQEIIMDQGMNSVITFKSLKSKIQPETYKINTNLTQIFCNDARFIGKHGITLIGEGMQISSQEFQLDILKKIAVFEQEVVLSTTLLY